MLHSGRLKQYWGFNEEEVRALCEQSGVEFADMQHWYDGYVMRGNVHVYNPYSVIEAVENHKFGDYWTQTETLESLKKYIDMDFDGLQEAIVQLLGGAHYRIDEYTFLNDMTNIHFADDVLTLLVHLGYLSYNSEEKTVHIPNEEIRQEFIRAVKKR
jgi:hypothetical protein